MEKVIERLEHLEDLLIVLIDGHKKAEESKTDLAEIIQAIKRLGSMEEDLAIIKRVIDSTDSKNEITKLMTVCSNLISDTESKNELVTDLIKGIPKRIKVAVEHKFTDKTRPYIWIFAASIFVSAFSVVSSIVLWSRNSELSDNSIKYRAVRLLKPTWALKTDSLYYKDPEGFNDDVRQQEERLLLITRIKEDMDRKVKEAESAKEKLEKMQKK